MLSAPVFLPDKLAYGAVDVGTLCSAADAVAFVRAEPLSTDTEGTWQGIEIREVENVKGRLPVSDRDPRYPWIIGKPTGDAARPTWLAREGYYLVFLREDRPEKPGYWPLLAAYRVEYRPDATGRVLGRLVGTSVDPATVRRLLGQLVDAGMGAKDAAERLNGWLASVAKAMSHEPATHEAMLRETREVAAAIKPGTARRDVEKVFLQPDGGISSLDATRYYVGQEVMVSVPYDRSGRVSGPLKVYRSPMHID